MKTLPIRLSITLSAQAILGWFREVHGSKVVTHLTQGQGVELEHYEQGSP
jgi:hypothetical protein